MPANETFTPARAAKQVNIPGSTLRHWARVYAEFLSPGSNPEPGTQRQFTGQDVEVLRAVAQLRANGLQPAEIAERLRQQPATELQNAVETATSLPAVQDDLHSPSEAIQRFLQQNEVKDKFAAVDRRLERLEARNTLLIAIAAFVAGVALVAVVVWMLSIVR